MIIMNDLKCSECQKNFSKRWGLTKHIKRFHPDKLDVLLPKKTYNYHCEICNKNYTHLRNLQHHKRIHESIKSVSKIPSKHLICSICDYQGLSTEELLAHFGQVHEIQIESHNLEFSSLDEFKTWKGKIENDTKSRFVKQTGTFLAKTRSTAIYVCHRSGIYIAKGKGSHHLKTQGSNKIDGFCPASMKVVLEKNGKCLVKFLETHVGHVNELGHLSLSLVDKQILACKIASKKSYTEILNEVRDSIQGLQPERIHLLTKNDLYRIEKSINLQSTSIQDKINTSSIATHSNQVENLNYILFCKVEETISEEYPELEYGDSILIIMNKEQEEMLKKYGSDCICIDGTRGLTECGSYELNTLFVLDEIREGFPCAFLISNRSDEYVMSIFLNCVKVQIRMTITTKVFMSGLDESYYNAWRKVMNQPQFRLYCTWRVDQGWKINLQKINSEEKQKEVYASLKFMLQERNIELFSEMPKNFFNDLNNDPTTVEFASYFKKNYLNKVELWAHCYRLNLGLNTKMNIERIQKTINLLFLQARKVDELINLILRFVVNELCERLTVINKGNPLDKLKDLHTQHTASESLDINSIKENGIGWDYILESTSDFYTIEKNDFECNCKLICPDCDTCIHKYSCSCLDLCRESKMCKHIHLLCTYLKEKTKEIKQLELDEEDCMFIIYNDLDATEMNKIVSNLNDDNELANKTIVDPTGLLITKEKEELKTSLIEIIDKITLHR